MSDTTYCTACLYFKYTNEDSDSWYGARCEKDEHEAQPSMYAIKALHDRCPLTKESDKDCLLSDVESTVIEGSEE